MIVNQTGQAGPFNNLAHSLAYKLVHINLLLHGPVQISLSLRGLVQVNLFLNIAVAIDFVLQRTELV